MSGAINMYVRGVGGGKYSSEIRVGVIGTDGGARMAMEVRLREPKGALKRYNGFLFSQMLTIVQNDIIKENKLKKKVKL